MPRSNRPRNKRGSAHDDDEFDITRVLAGRLRTETKRSGEFRVQPVAATSAVKSYVCPGCGLDIQPETAHVVAWRADALMGEAHALSERRHWHSHCWKIAN